jgi:GDP-4-dehydro-6-deoxy-D-mannose reductase
VTTALVTGSHGWVGTHLRRLLVERGHHVVGVGRRPEVAGPDETYARVDLRVASEVTALVERTRPDVVFHLAAATPQREPDVGRLVAECVDTTQHLCQALRNAAARDDAYRPQLILAGSSGQYGAVPPEQNPITEDSLPRPVGAYGHAKAAAESIAFALASDGLVSVIAARPFNHVGPGERSGTVAGALATRVADVLLGRADRVRVADLDAVRDFTDVRDVARAYVALADGGLAGSTYNVCSGSPTTVRAILADLLDLAGLDWSVVEVIPGRSSIPYQVGSAERIEAATSWKAEIPLRQSLADLLAEKMAGTNQTDEHHREGTA